MRQLTISEISQEAIDKSLYININIAYDDIAALVMGLQLLEYDFSTEFKVHNKSFSEAFVIKVSREVKYSKIKKGDYINLILSLNDLQAVTSFLLFYYMHHCAPADHMHVYLGKDEQSILTILANEYEEPLSAEEAKLLLESD